MYTSVVMVALAGLSAAPQEAPPKVSWEASYAVAYQKGQQMNKPLAVLVGSGVEGWQGVSTDKALSARALELLAARYVCVYVDTSKPAGRDLADQLEVRGKAGLVLSTRGGKSQAFSHQGQLTPTDLESALARYASPRRVVRTETLGTRSVRFSHAAALKRAKKLKAAPRSAPISAPAFRFGATPSFGGGGGCPNCR
jgi:hypothetical protein